MSKDEDQPPNHFFIPKEGIIMLKKIESSIRLVIGAVNFNPIIAIKITAIIII